MGRKMERILRGGTLSCGPPPVFTTGPVGKGICDVGRCDYGFRTALMSCLEQAFGLHKGCLAWAAQEQSKGTQRPKDNSERNDSELSPPHHLLRHIERLDELGDGCSQFVLLPRGRHQPNAAGTLTGRPISHSISSQMLLCADSPSNQRLLWGGSKDSPGHAEDEGWLGGRGSSRSFVR